MLISINSKTNGKFHRETINGRSHVVTNMMAIRGDTSMNGVLYPNAELLKSVNQFKRLPVPNGHPKVNGVHISAYDPVAMNAHNIGAFTRNPKMNGKELHVEVLVDEVVANMTEDGKETIKRITEGGKIGVSTGLNIAQVSEESGTDDLGADFSRTGYGFTFDHVASLLNEKAAGEHAGTEMILNTENPNDPIYVVNMEHGTGDGITQTNELTAYAIEDALRELLKAGIVGSDTYVWISDLFPDSKSIVFTIEGDGNTKYFKQSYAVDSNDNVTLLDDRVEGVRKTEFVQTNNSEDEDMNKDLLISFIIANAFNAFNGEDKDRLNAMNESQLIEALCVNVDKDKAQEVLTANGFDFPAYEDFITNKASFEAFQKSEGERLDTIREGITTNSDYTPEMLEGKSEDELSVINKMITGGQTTRVPEGSAPVVNSGASVDASEYVM